MLAAVLWNTDVLVRLPRKPQEVHSRYQDGLWWSEEAQGEERPYHVSLLSRPASQLSLVPCPISHTNIFPPLFSYLKESTA